MTDDSRAPRFSVVIPTHGRREAVLAAVHALERLERGPSFEVVVVVDGSPDGTAEALGGLDPPFVLTVIEQPHRGSATARNRGAAVARGELLLFLDDDMEADPRLLHEHDRSHREGADAVLGHIPLHPDSPQSFLAAAVGTWAEERRASLLERGGRLELDDYLTGQLSIGRDLFVELGGFDTRFTRDGRFGGADFDFGLRLVRAGRRLVFEPHAVSFHRYVVDPRHRLRQWRDHGRAAVVLARRHPDERDAILEAALGRSDNLVSRRLRPLLRELALALLQAGFHGRWVTSLYWRVNRLEYLQGVRDAGGIPAPRPVRVLCYHAIADLEGAGSLEAYGVPPGRFRRQLAFLSRRFRPIDAAEFRGMLEGGGVPRRAVLVTFDDGFQDLRDTALPILRDLHVPAVAFAVTALAGGRSDWIADERARRPLLDVDALKELARDDVSVESHTRTHRSLVGLSIDELDEEIAGSVRDLVAAGVGRPTFVAYPYGEFDERAMRAAKAAGLAGAFTTQPGIAEPGQHPFAIPRIEIVRGDGPLRFLWKVWTGRGSG